MRRRRQKSHRTTSTHSTTNLIILCKGWTTMSQNVSVGVLGYKLTTIESPLSWLKNDFFLVKIMFWLINIQQNVLVLNNNKDMMYFYMSIVLEVSTPHVNISADFPVLTLVCFCTCTQTLNVGYE